jgi:FAD/FMN-containing dehydrogenase
VRSGGHSPNPTWSSVGSDGILLDLGGLDSITVSGDGSFASVGAGAQWGDVYSVVDSRRAFVVGARIPTIGVGGSILGGLLPFFRCKVLD